MATGVNYSLREDKCEHGRGLWWDKFLTWFEMSSGRCAEEEGQGEEVRGRVHGGREEGR